MISRWIQEKYQIFIQLALGQTRLTIKVTELMGKATEINRPNLIILAVDENISLNFRQLSKEIRIMTSDSEKVVVHLELSRQTAALLYALNKHVLKLRAPADADDEINDLSDSDGFDTANIANALRVAFVGKHKGNPLLPFTQEQFDELTHELGTTLWDALN
jgi:hypothetical protein